MEVVKLFAQELEISAHRLEELISESRLTFPEVGTAEVSWNETKVLDVFYQLVPTGLWKVS